MYEILININGKYIALRDEFATEDSARRFANLFVAADYKIQLKESELISDCSVINLADYKTKREPSNV